jgi:hypothetical protein
VTPVLACWALLVPIAQPSLVRIRPISGTSVAPWSVYTTVPEPGLAPAIAAAFALSSEIARRRRRIGNKIKPRA